MNTKRLGRLRQVQVGPPPLPLDQELLRARRLVGAAYVRQHCTADELEAIMALERENDAVRGRIDAMRRDGFVRTGRYMLGRTMAVSVLAVGLMMALAWYHLTEDGADFKVELDKGYNAPLFPVPATAARPVGHAAAVR